MKACFRLFFIFCLLTGATYFAQTKVEEVQFSAHARVPGYKRLTKKNPEMFQGFKEEKNYFEGWYFKMVSEKGTDAISVIPGISLSGNSEDQHAFIQVINGKTAETYYYKFDISTFYFSPQNFSVRIGENYFSREGIRFNLENDSTRISGEVDFKGCKQLDEKSIMGWYYNVPFMQCYHGVVSLDHQVNGEIKINEDIHSFSKGNGYIEKDWGKSMPSSWIWMQTNSFTQTGTSFMLSIANIPWLGKEFTGFLGFFLKDNKIETFGTYSKADLTFTETKEGLEINISTKESNFHIQAKKSESGLLAAPINGSMDRRIAESVDAKILISVKDKEGVEIYRDSSSVSGLEIVGELSTLSKVK